MEGLPGGPERITITADRTRPGTYLTVVEFASYEAAMENSHRPETSDFAKGKAALCDGPPTFYDLDVLSTEVRMDAGKATQKARG